MGGSSCPGLFQACLGMGYLRVGWPHSPSLSPQSSQPSTTSPFKQEVFVYSPSPSSESPSLGAAATPIIMSRSPTGQWHLGVCAMGLGPLLQGVRTRQAKLAGFCSCSNTL